MSKGCNKLGGCMGPECTGQGCCCWGGGPCNISNGGPNDDPNCNPDCKGRSNTVSLSSKQSKCCNKLMGCSGTDCTGEGCSCWGGGPCVIPKAQEPERCAPCCPVPQQNDFTPTPAGLKSSCSPICEGLPRNGPNAMNGGSCPPCCPGLVPQSQPNQGGKCPPSCLGILNSQEEQKGACPPCCPNLPQPIENKGFCPPDCLGLPQSQNAGMCPPCCPGLPPPPTTQSGVCPPCCPGLPPPSEQGGVCPPCCPGLPPPTAQGGFCPPCCPGLPPPTDQGGVCPPCCPGLPQLPTEKGGVCPPSCLGLNQGPPPPADEKKCPPCCPANLNQQTSSCDKNAGCPGSSCTGIGCRCWGGSKKPNFDQNNQNNLNVSTGQNRDGCQPNCGPQQQQQQQQQFPMQISICQPNCGPPQQQQFQMNGNVPKGNMCNPDCGPFQQQQFQMNGNAPKGNMCNPDCGPIQQQQFQMNGNVPKGNMCNPDCGPLQQEQFQVNNQQNCQPDCGPPQNMNERQRGGAYQPDYEMCLPDCGMSYPDSNNTARTPSRTQLKVLPQNSSKSYSMNTARGLSRLTGFKKI